MSPCIEHRIERRRSVIRAAARISTSVLALSLAGCFQGLVTEVTNRVTNKDAGSGGSSATTGTGGEGHGGSGGTGGATGGGGTGSVGCIPGETRPCYTGPAGTLGVGLCKGGVNVCDALGVFGSECVGQVLPKAETCLTPFDEDCNGEANEGGTGCACAPGEVESCYTGPPGTLGVGICKGGTRTCAADGTGFGPCEGDVTPTPETCLDLLDNDCNGEVNEDGMGCICTPGEVVPCYTGPAGTMGVGACAAGAKTCDAHGSSFGPCVGEVTPLPETCNTPGDDDCNGQVNEGGPGCVCVPGSTQACYTGPAGTMGVGVCAAGMETCLPDGKGYGPCVGEVLPQPETCLDTVDNDCNGQTNEGGVGCVCTPNAIVSCYSGPPGTMGVGVCKGGTATCNAQGTAIGPCSGEVLPQIENCFNGVDDNCDGQTNENCACNPGDVVSCYSGPAGTLGVGVCASGTRTCDDTTLTYGPCVGDVTPQPETCNTPVDDNCNGQVNEGGVGCVCTPNATTSCYSGPPGTAGVGICLSGTHTCDAQGTSFGPCTGEVLPQPETCLDTVDNDCNGQVNEGGAGCVCLPNSTQSCYSGPPGTAGVGACKSGLRTCNAQGTAYGACVGEVLPQAETCSTPVDDDCNGQTNEGGAGCVCAPNATQPCYSGPTGTLGIGVCVGGTQACNGLGTAWGPCTGEITPQTEDCGTPEDDDCDGTAPVCPGALEWAKGFGSIVDDEGIAIGSDPSNNVLLAGYMNGTIDYGCGAITAGSADGALIVKLTPGGSCLWSKRFGVLANVNSVASDPSSNVILLGNFANPIDFGGGTINPAGGADLYIAKFDPAGNHLWSHGYGDAQTQVSERVTTDASGNIYATGYFKGTIDFGGSPMTTAGNNDIFLAKLSPTGSLLWSKRFGDGGAQAGKGVAVDPSGNVIVVGNLSGGADFGGGTISSNGLLNDIFVAKFSPTGTHLWSKRFGDSTDQQCFGVATDPSGNVIITGFFNGSVDFGGGHVITTGGAEDVYLAKLDPSGNTLWASGYGGTSSQSALGVATDAAGNIAITGVLFGAPDFGGGPLTNVGGGDGYVAKFAPSGAHLWSKRFGDSAAQGSKAIAVDSAGSVLISGIIFGPTDFGLGDVPLVGGEDIFVAKYAP
jgi:hypothetical protein